MARPRTLPSTCPPGQRQPGEMGRVSVQCKWDAVECSPGIENHGEGPGQSVPQSWYWCSEWGDTLASCHPPPPIPGQERWEPGLRLYTLALLTPLYKTAFPALFYKPPLALGEGSGGRGDPTTRKHLAAAHPPHLTCTGA